MIRIPATSLATALALQYLAASTGMAQASAENAAKMPEASSVESAIPAARQALPQLQPLVSEQTYRQLGFASVAEVKDATLGAPLSVYMVPLDRLREFTPETKAESLIVPTNEALFPVQVGDQVRTGLKLRNVDGKWRFSSFGASDVVKAVAKTAKTASARPRAIAGSQFVVTVPALHLYFIAHREPEGLMFTPTASDTRFKLQPGRSLPASAALQELVPYAKRYKSGEHLVD